MPNWKKVITSGSSANLNNIDATGYIHASNGAQVTGSMVISGSAGYGEGVLEIKLSPAGGVGSGLVISGSTYNGTPLMNLVQEEIGGTGAGEFIYGKGPMIDAGYTASFHIRQTPGGGGSFTLFSSHSAVGFTTAGQVETHKFMDPTQDPAGIRSWVNFSSHSTDAKFGIGTDNPQYNLHVSGTFWADDGQIGNNTIYMAGAAGHITASGDISASGTGSFGNLEIAGIGGAMLEVVGDISASGDFYGDDLNLAGYYSQDLKFGKSDHTIYIDETQSGFGHGGNLTLNAGDGISDAGEDRDGGNIILTPGAKTNSGDAGMVVVNGDISASGNLILGDLGGGTYISASQGNLELSGSGIGELTVDHRYFDTGSATVSTVGGAIGDTFKFGNSSGLDEGKCYYLDPTGNWTATDADGGGKTSGSIAIATNAAATNGMCLRGIVSMSHDPGGGIGAPLYISAAAGELTSTVPGAGQFVRVVGHNLNETGLIFFNPGDVTIEVA